MRPNWFIGVPVPDDQWFESACSVLPAGLQVFHPADLHITVAFLGPVDEKTALSAWDVARKQVLPDQTISLESMEAFGPVDRPSAIAVVPSQGKRQLSAFIGAHRDRILLHAGRNRDKYPPRPHVTVARIPRKASAEERAAYVEQVLELYCPACPSTSVVLSCIHGRETARSDVSGILKPLEFRRGGIYGSDWAVFFNAFHSVLWSEKPSSGNTMSISRRSFLTRIASVPVAAATAPAVVGRRKRLPDSSDYLELFDGQTLAGWHVNPEKINHGTGGRWRVEEGAIIGEQDPPGSGNGGVLLTDLRFADFELLLEIKPDWGPDSGLFLRANDRGQCFQMMVDYHENGNVGFVYGEGTGGFAAVPFRLTGRYDEGGELVGFESAANNAYSETPLPYVCTPDTWMKAWNIDDWNRVRVVCVGQYPVIKTWINEAQVCEFSAAQFQHPLYDRERVYQMLGREGSIGVQVHGGTQWWPEGKKCRWRGIKIRPL